MRITFIKENRDAGTESISTCERRIGLGKERRLFFYQFRFGHAGQTAHFQQYDAVVAAEPTGISTSSPAYAPLRSTDATARANGG